MSFALPDDLLERRPAEAARLIALWRLRALLDARPRLDDANDIEAVHDARVALRRLRSCLRSHRDLLGDAANKKLLKRLRDIARQSGPARDAEVQLEWLSALAEPGEAERAGRAWLRERLTERKEEGGIELRRAFGERFERVREALELRLHLVQHAVGEGAAPTFREAAVVAVRAHTRELEAALTAALALRNHMEANHRARILGKRLRYLLEPLAEQVPSWAQVIDTLKSLQQVLGDLHDAQVMEQLTAQCSDEAPPEARAGLRALGLEASRRSDRLFAELERSPARRELAALTAS